MLTQPCAGEMYTRFRPGEVISNVLVSLYANSYGNLTGCSLWSAKSEMPTLASIDNRIGVVEARVAESANPLVARLFFSAGFAFAPISKVDK